MAPLAIVPQVGHSLALAIVDATDAPVLLLHQDLCVIAASASFCLAYGFDPGTIIGKEIFELGGGEWNKPQLRSLLRATANGQATVEGYEFELKRGGHPTLCLIAKAHKLNFSDAGEVRLLLTVVDITVARDSERLKGNCSRGWRRGCQATAKFPSMRSRIAWRAGWPLMRAVPVTDRYPAWI
jgi:hypothetical protein